MLFSVDIQNVQHIQNAVFRIDASRHGLMCIVGRNGIGKTTLIKAIRNFHTADTFAKTTQAQAFGPDSSITYSIEGKTYSFIYDENLKSLNCHIAIPGAERSQVDAELPIPYGHRFNFFQEISNADFEIRRAIVLEQYQRPDELIAFMAEVYGNRKFDDLVEVKARGTSYFCIPQAENRYIREDHLSSGEYFIINLYRKIRNRRKLIVVDEIDISLDAAAQVHLIKNLRRFCAQYGTNIVFTTHSLAMMRTLAEDELFYMEERNGVIQPFAASYNYVRSRLFGFIGWDKYILTEDGQLQGFIEYVIGRYCSKVRFYSHKIIYVGGAGNVIDLMKRNEKEQFLAPAEDVIAILDGDQANKRLTRGMDAVHYIPFRNVEHAILEHYELPHFPYKLPAGVRYVNPKSLFNELQRYKVMSREQAYEFLCGTCPAAINAFSQQIESFLTQKST